MGWSIEVGTWCALYVVYDLDGDGKAEVHCKGGEGDPREPEGHVKTGLEWLFKLDGQTGEIVKKIPWIPRLSEIGDYNYLCRNILAEHPGQECYAGEAKGGDQAWMYTAQGKWIGNENIGSLAPWTLWWDADPQKEILLRGDLLNWSEPLDWIAADIYPYYFGRNENDTDAIEWDMKRSRLLMAFLRCAGRHHGIPFAWWVGCTSSTEETPKAIRHMSYVAIG